MKNKMIWKFIMPTFAIILLMTLTAVLAIAGYVRRQIKERAHDQIAAKIEQVADSLDVTNTVMLEKVHLSMTMLMTQGLAAGRPSLGAKTRVGNEIVPNLALGGKQQANNFALVDQVKSSMGGTATLFVKRDGDFVRVTTNVMKDDGSRAVGTFLDPKGKAIASIKEGKAFYGQVDILGKPFVTGYEPMYDKDNKIVGVWYVGYPVATFTQLGETIARTKILDEGFIALMDDRDKVRFVSKHMNNDAVENTLRNPSGQFNKWLTIERPFEPWGFKIVAAYRESEINRKIAVAITVVIILGLIFALSLIGLLYFLVKRIILVPINTMITAADHLAKGDLRVNLENNSKDEAGQLIMAINNLIGNLKKIILRTAESSRQVSMASDQIAAANQNFSQRITEQASSIEETSATMEEMSASIRHTADNAREVSKLGQTTMMLAHSGAAVMTETMKAIDEINRSSAKVANITKVIEEIAFQTNLLALNAAVEAARAGEHGKGFAVVAAEIRSLAQRASRSTKEIAELIEDSVEKTTKGTQLSRELSRKLEEIGSSVRKVTDLMDEVAGANGEQAIGINQINLAVSQIDQTTQQNASLVEETASAGEQLALQAKELMGLISFFTIDDEASSGSELMPERHKEARQAAVESTIITSARTAHARPFFAETAKPAFVSLLRKEDSNGGFEEF